MKISEKKLRNIVREEIRNVVREKKQVNELASFREDRMRAFLRKNPNVRAIYNRENIDLKTLWDREVHGNAKREREYSHAL